MKVAAIAAVFVLLVIGHMEAMGWAVAVVAFVLLPGLPIGGFYVAASVFRRRRRDVLIGLTIWGFVIANLLVGSLIVHAQVQESQRRGDAIAVALDVCRRRVGSFPPSLDALVPADLPRVPPTAMGALSTFEFRYRTDDKADFILSFDVPAYFGCWRTATTDWTMID